MRRAPWCALLCCVAAPAAAQERAVTFEEPQPVTVTGFAVGGADYARRSKLTGVQVHYTASPRFGVWAAGVNGWDVARDNNRGKTALARAQWIAIPWVTLGVTGVYGPERDSTDAHQRSLVSGDLTIDRGPVILGAELNLGREQNPGGDLTWRGGAGAGAPPAGPRAGA